VRQGQGGDKLSENREMRQVRGGWGMQWIHRARTPAFPNAFTIKELCPSAPRMRGSAMAVRVCAIFLRFSGPDLTRLSYRIRENNTFMGTEEQSQTEGISARFLCLTLFLCTIILFQDLVSHRSFPWAAFELQKD
jgi:hypothetical protein